MLSLELARCICARLQDGASCSSQRPHHLRGHLCSFVCGRQPLTTTLCPPVGRDRPLLTDPGLTMWACRVPCRSERLCAGHSMSAAPKIVRRTQSLTFGRVRARQWAKTNHHSDDETIGERLCAELRVLTSRECKPAHNLSP